jgi:hypothetical protein
MVLYNTINSWQALSVKSDTESSCQPVGLLTRIGEPQEYPNTGPTVQNLEWIKQYLSSQMSKLQDVTEKERYWEGKSQTKLNLKKTLGRWDYESRASLITCP